MRKIALLVLTASALFGLDTSKLKPTGYVNDFAHALDPVAARRLELYCANLERVTGVQMAIVLVDSLEDEPVEDVANRLFREDRLAGTAEVLAPNLRQRTRQPLP